MLTQIVLSGLFAAVVTADSSSLVEATSKDNSAQCDCYVVSGADPGYFQYFRFWDFRNIQGSMFGSDFRSPPPLVTASQNQGSENTTSPYFNTTQFMADWSIQSGVAMAGSPVSSLNSAANVFISSGGDGTNSTYLALRASRLDQFASVCEIDSNQQNVLHGSFRARMRVVPNFANQSAPFVNNGVSTATVPGINGSHPVAPGAVLGFFTYLSDTQESDIEILTRDPTTHIRYSNQPDYDAKTGNTVPGASTDAIMPNGIVWTDWHDHRLDWYEGISRWYVDDILVLEKKLNVPTKPSGLVLNLWSDGGEWSGNMSVGSQVVAGVQWIEMAFNISGKNPGKRSGSKSRNVGCTIDKVNTTGFPQVAFNATGNIGGRLTVGDGIGVQLTVMFWIAIVFSWFQLG